MATVLLVRHGRTTANASGVLAGWTPGVGLDETGRAQAQALARRVAVLPVVRVWSSPLQRCQETAAELVAVDGPPLTKGRRRAATGTARPPVELDAQLGECHYGDWTGKALKDLAKDPLWRVVQTHPSAVTFPGESGESMLGMQQRAVDAIRGHDREVAAAFGDDALWVAVSHGDVIKAILADALGMHLDAFQRIIVDPASVSVVRYTPLRPFAVRVNDGGGDLAGLVPAPGPTRRRSARALSSDAVVGGTSGAQPAGGPAVSTQ